MERNWYHPVEIIKNRYLVRVISFVFHLVPLMVLEKQRTFLYRDTTTSEVEALKAITATLMAFNIIGMILHVLFMIFYCFKKRNEKYMIVVGSREFNGIKIEIVMDAIMLIIMGFLGAYGVYISICRMYHKEIQQTGDKPTIDWCARKSTALAFALINAGWYSFVIVGLDVYTLTRKPKSSTGNQGSNMELNTVQKSTPSTSTAAAPAEPAKARWPPEN